MPNRPPLACNWKPRRYTCERNEGGQDEALDIVPASQSAIDVKTGKAESVDVPEEAGLKAALEGNTVKITASPDAKEGTHLVTVKNSKGEKTTFKVNVKKK
jgi:hypothetical protein